MYIINFRYNWILCKW